MARVRNSFWKKTADALVQSDIIPVIFKQYINFGTTGGETGYGFRDNAGTLQFKNSAGSWANIGGGGGGGDMLSTNNLSDVANAATARTNLGLGTAAQSATTDFAPALGSDDNYVTDAEKAALHTHSNKAVLDATTASFTTADETKLDGIEAGADVTDSTNVLAALSGQNPVLNLVTYDAARGKVTDAGNLGATETINFNDETTYLGDLDSNITLTFANVSVGDEVTIVGRYSGAQRTITYPGGATIIWCNNLDGSEPTTPSASGDYLVITLRCIASNTYLASATGNYAVYS